MNLMKRISYVLVFPSLVRTSELPSASPPPPMKTIVIDGLVYELKSALSWPPSESSQTPPTTPPHVSDTSPAAQSTAVPVVLHESSTAEPTTEPVVSISRVSHAHSNVVLVPVQANALHPTVHPGDSTVKLGFNDQSSVRYPTVLPTQSAVSTTLLSGSLIEMQTRTTTLSTNEERTTSTTVHQMETTGEPTTVPAADPEEPSGKREILAGKGNRPLLITVYVLLGLVAFAVVAVVLFWRSNRTGSAATSVV